MCWASKVSEDKSRLLMEWISGKSRNLRTGWQKKKLSAKNELLKTTNKNRRVGNLSKILLDLHECCHFWLCNSTYRGLPGSSVHGISQSRILEWAAISFSKGLSWPRDWTCVFCLSRQILYHLATWEDFTGPSNVVKPCATNSEILSNTAQFGSNWKERKKS